MKQRGAVLHSNSGSGDIKHDGHDDVYLYEVKECGRTIRLSAKELRASFVRAIRQGRLPCWLVVFKDEGFTAEIRLVPGGQELVGD